MTTTSIFHSTISTSLLLFLPYADSSEFAHTKMSTHYSTTTGSGINEQKKYGEELLHDVKLQLLLKIKSFRNELTPF
jgi:hypothetical protein